MKSLFLILLTAGTLFANHFEPKMVDVEPTDLFVPNGFDANDEIEVVVDGYLPDTCHRLRSAEVQYQGNKILIQPRAQLFEGICHDVIVPYTTTVRLRLLPPGKYEVHTRTGNTRGELQIATVVPNQPIDNFLYLPVENATVELLNTGKLEGVLEVRFTNTCLRMKEIRKIHTGKTLQILPLMEKTDRDEKGNECVAKRFSKEYRFEMPALLPGRYLMHVRSLNGQSVNHVFETHW